MSLPVLPTVMLCVPCESYAITHKHYRHYYIQIGAYKSPHSAQNLLHSLKKKQISGRVLLATIKGQSLYEVQVGPYLNVQQANSKRKQLHQGYVRSYPLSASNAVLVTPVPPTFHKHRSTKKLVTVQPTIKAIAPSSRRLMTIIKPFAAMPYYPRIYGEGTWGQQTSFGGGDLMLPVIGNNDWMGYVDGAGKYGQDHAWYGSIGGGLRSVVANRIWGAYLFTDSNESIHHNNFWIANPGLEVLTPTWDARVNGYIPLGSRRKVLGTFKGGQIGPNGFVIQNRTLYEKIFNVMEATGPGIDGEVGYTFNRFFQVRAFAGGYYFNIPQSRTVGGVEGGIEIPINNKITLVLHDAYDPVQRNTAMGTLRITFGGIDKSNSSNVHTRMLDPIYRHLGAYQTGSGVPIPTYNKLVGQNPLLNNIWFFKPGGANFIPVNGLNNCTLENPCGTLTQQAIDGINYLAPSANFFFASGLYNNPAVGNNFKLNYGQNFFGRTAAFAQAATGNQRPLINDSLILPGNNAIFDLMLNGNSVSTGTLYGVQTTSTAIAPVAIVNSVINTQLNSPTSLNVVGFYNASTNNNVVNLLNTTVNTSITNSIGSLATGLATNGGAVNLINSTVNIAASNMGVTAIQGITLQLPDNNGTLNLYNSTVNLTASGVNLSQVVGINTLGTTATTVNMFNSKIYMNVANGQDSETYGAFINYKLNLFNSTIDQTTSNFSGLSVAEGLYLGSPLSIANMLNSKILMNATNVNDFVAGVNNLGGTYNALNSSIQINSNNSGTLYGSSGIDSSTNAVVNLNGVTIDVRGVTSTNIVVGINGGKIAYKNSTIKVNANTPGTAIAVLSPTSMLNLGNVVCTVIQDGVTTVQPCP